MVGSQSSTLREEERGRRKKEEGGREEGGRKAGGRKGGRKGGRRKEGRMEKEWRKEGGRRRKEGKGHNFKTMVQNENAGVSSCYKEAARDCQGLWEGAAGLLHGSPGSHASTQHTHHHIHHHNTRHTTTHNTVRLSHLAVAHKAERDGAFPHKTVTEDGELQELGGWGVHSVGCGY